MKGDFSRVTFDPRNHFSRVLTQQGRVTLDADHNEQTDIALHTMRTLVRDLFGSHGGPANGRGFGLYIDSTNAPPYKLMIGAGHYYVDGILCECDLEYDYANQPDYAPVPADAAAGTPDPLLSWLKNPTGITSGFCLYLDVWERHITWVEDDSIREVALGGPDTCTRSKVVWQVKAISLSALTDVLSMKLAAETQSAAPDQQLITTLKYAIPLLAKGETDGQCAAVPYAFPPDSNAQMAARLDPGVQIPDPCSISPDSQYRGAENQLYRIEIHQGGMVGDAAAPTFKWSRDNGSVVAGWLATDAGSLVVTSGRGFSVGCWVELSWDQLDLQGQAGIMVKLANVQSDRFTVAPDSIGTQSIAWMQQFSNPKVRRWDQSDSDKVTLVSGAVAIVEASAADPAWIDLEDGLQIQFAAGGHYNSGDYWLVPARVATGSMEWPMAVGTNGIPETDQNGNTFAALLPPRGVRHHYAPLGFVGLANGQEGAGVRNSCRNCCSPLNAATCGLVGAPTASAPVRGLIAFKPTASRSSGSARKKSGQGSSTQASGKPSAKGKRR